LEAQDNQLRDKDLVIAKMRQKDESTEPERKEMMKMSLNADKNEGAIQNGNHSNNGNKHKMVDESKLPKKKKMSNEMA
jgi:hypothetical protein